MPDDHVIGGRVDHRDAQRWVSFHDSPPGVDCVNLLLLEASTFPLTVGRNGGARKAKVPASARLGPFTRPAEQDGRVQSRSRDNLQDVCRVSAAAFGLSTLNPCRMTENAGTNGIPVKPIGSRGDVE